MSEGEQRFSAEEADKVIDVVRDLIRHENELVHQRIYGLFKPTVCFSLRRFGLPGRSRDSSQC
jgi:hypothetical protein